MDALRFTYPQEVVDLPRSVSDAKKGDIFKVTWPYHIFALSRISGFEDLLVVALAYDVKKTPLMRGLFPGADIAKRLNTLDASFPLRRAAHFDMDAVTEEQPKKHKGYIKSSFID